uniref:Aquaporin putative n=1 Tax=Albugo laibachii Nc14 TaxID=890382 RepID=F0WPQ0_9STRA|nr:aquaporin putative [Albugo laibachii Nc14]|eukprot:CCA23301.1 aquaporin putative [Albugo laibachii Nc14]
MAHQELSVIMDGDMEADMRQPASVERVTSGGDKGGRYSNFDYEPEIPTMGLFNEYGTKNQLLRECLAEFLGTFVLVCFGDGVVAQVVLSKQTSGMYLSINLCWGLGVLFGIHCSGGVSGAHLNPAVSTTLALFRRFSWRKVPFYILAQLLGAFCGAAMVLAIYYPVFNVVDPERKTTHGVFATYPGEAVSNGSAFLCEVFGTALLVGGIFAIGDRHNKPASPYSAPSAIALLVVAIGMAFGMNTGYAINPARDLSPRFLSAIGGWGFKTFSMRNYYFWVPILGPILGGAIGAGVYQLCVEMHHPIRVNERDKDEYVGF